ncbi:Na+/H+ antiporter [Actinorhabdospora filicis]|uniref:Na+/H+ antiporter n=1 Tax=Actinorhabdospora filicis TaxID=1785913 RepID=A0A9W6WBS4_9ACTN|nr:Na+/H+ antiporter [Actinorhabdospora filicis]GLZ79866.1 Na+/H+ antiporter [Actinorhabdospora filicis]
MGQFSLLFLLVLGGILLIPLAERLRVPAPVLTTFYGLLLGVLPFIPNLAVPPELILPLVLPPLLYAAARRSSWREFADNYQPILVLAVVLVFVTTAAVALVAATVHPVLPVGVAIVLGVIVSPPDAAAVTTIAGRLGLPRRTVTILEGEGLFNDVTALTLYQVAIAGVLTGSISVWGAVGSFAYSSLAAIVVGLLIGFAAKLLLDHLSDARLTTALSLLIPYLAYLPAEELGASGVLSVLVTAFYLGAKSQDPDDIEGRMIRGSFWEVTELMVTAVTFGLIGLELVNVWRDVGGSAATLLLQALLISGTVIAVRALWMTIGWLMSRRGLNWRGRTFDWREALVTGWSGMRGVVTIVTALAVPFTVDDGSAFPGRSQVLFVSMVVVVVTLLLQGLTLPWIIARIGLRRDAEREAAALRKVITVAEDAAFAALDEIIREKGLDREIGDRMRARFELLFLAPEDLPDAELSEERRRVIERRDYLRATERHLLSAARSALVDARRSPGYDPVVIDQVLGTLDVRSAALGTP